MPSTGLLHSFKSALGFVWGRATASCAPSEALSTYMLTGVMKKVETLGPAVGGDDPEAAELAAKREKFDTLTEAAGQLLELGTKCYEDCLVATSCIKFNSSSSKHSLRDSQL